MAQELDEDVIEITVAGLMMAGAATQRERAAVYGDGASRFAAAMIALFPEGLTLTTEQDFKRYGLLTQIVSKLARYTNHFDTPHRDSIHDLGVYAFMLEHADLAL